MTRTPLLDRPTRPDDLRPSAPTGRRGGRIFAVVLGVLLLAAVAVLMFATDIAREPLDGTPAVPADTAPEVAPPAEEPAAEPAEAPIRYGEELRANWIVIGIAADDVLNVRSGPGVSFDVIGELTLTSPELESTGYIADVGDQLWRQIVVPGDGVGWVNAKFLGDIPPPPSAEIRYREEPRANWDVDGVAADDVLNVRAGPGVSSEIVATLAPDAAELESTGRIADVGTALWREIVVPGDGAGWVNAAFLTETE